MAQVGKNWLNWPRMLLHNTFRNILKESFVGTPYVKLYYKVTRYITSTMCKKTERARSWDRCNCFVWLSAPTPNIIRIFLLLLLPSLIVIVFVWLSQSYADLCLFACYCNFLAFCFGQMLHIFFFRSCPPPTQYYAFVFKLSPLLLPNVVTHYSHILRCICLIVIV